jgi:hypothetical protein
MMADTCSRFAHFPSLCKDGPAKEKDFLTQSLVVPLAGPRSGRKSPSHGGALGGRPTSNRQIARYRGTHGRRNPSESGRLGHGFQPGIHPRCRRLARQGCCGKDTVQEPKSRPVSFLALRQRPVDGAAKFGRGGRGLVESIFPSGKTRFSAMRVCKFFL